jgi:hypothetical protein
MQKVYVVTDTLDGKVVGVASSERSARRLMIKYITEYYEDCDILGGDNEQSNYDPRITYYEFDYVTFEITETNLVE